MHNDDYERLRRAARGGDLDAADALITESLRRRDPAGQLEALIALEIATDGPTPALEEASRRLWASIAPLLSEWDPADMAGLDAMVDWLEGVLGELEGFTVDVIAAPDAWVRALYRGRGHAGLRLCRVLELVPPGKFPPWRLARPLRALTASPHLDAVERLEVAWDPARQAPIFDAEALEVLAGWSRLPHLTHLSLRRQALTDDALEGILGWPLDALRVLDLSWNAFSDAGFSALVHAAALPPRLERLDLSGHRGFHAAPVEHWRALGALEALEHLDLSRCGIFNMEALEGFAARERPRVEVAHNPGFAMQVSLDRYRELYADLLEDDYDDGWE